MMQLAERLDTTAATISRYESGKFLPDRPALLKLLGIAEGDEREAILNALGVERGGWTEQGLANALKTFEAYLATRSGKSPKRRKSDLLAEFARAASAIIERNETIEPGLVDILNHWLKHGRNPAARQFFRYVAVFLDVQLREFENDIDRSPRKGKDG